MHSSLVTHTEEETIAAAEHFSRRLLDGDVVALRGDLGSGKTQFAKGVCRGLGIREHVTSPTFTIVNEYNGGKFPVYHFDFYRLRSLNELNEIGYDEYINDEGVCLLEWADMIEEKLPVRRYDVQLSLGTTNTERIIQISRMQ
ncbi:MAG: tRNA (adenosine(37)-N6)-threonylcarbamoyltransferase complex ATPase subunit type 1 TsaE [Bacteroidota bacterium]|nr:tRNA (adenosine(37)-N6)-threonylcarbamoyltransferase complex ATPase subunit type 1 TsaE [Bacteroidota bacterium]